MFYGKFINSNSVPNQATIQELCIKMRVKSPIMSNYKILALMNPSGANIVQCCENNFYTA